MSYKEWEIEPNKMNFMHSGLSCLIERNEKFGFLNAYVFVPESNIYHGLDYDHVHVLLGKELGVEITFGELKGSNWAYGFSFSSVRDFIPHEPNDPSFEPLKGFFESMKKATGIDPTEKDYKNIEYAIAKVQKLAEFLARKPAN